jgi:hypothetical protein
LTKLSATIEHHLGYLIKRTRPNGNRVTTIWKKHVADGDDEPASNHRQADIGLCDNGLATLGDADGTSELQKLFSKLDPKRRNEKC